MKKIVALLFLTTTLASASSVSVDDMHANFDVKSCIKSGTNVTCQGTVSFDQETTITTNHYNYTFSIISPDGEESASETMFIQNQSAENGIAVHDGISYSFTVKFDNYKSSQLKYFYILAYAGAGGGRYKVENVPFFMAAAPKVIGTVKSVAPTNIGQHKYNVSLQDCRTPVASDAFVCVAVFVPQK